MTHVLPFYRVAPGEAPAGVKLVLSTQNPYIFPSLFGRVHSQEVAT